MSCVEPEPPAEAEESPDPTGWKGEDNSQSWQLTWRDDLGSWWVGFWSKPAVGGAARSWTTLPAAMSLYQAVAHLEAQGYRGTFTYPVRDRFGGQR